MADQDALERLSAAYRIEVDEGTKERHIAEMSTAIRTAPPATSSHRICPSKPRCRRRRGRVVVVAPVGMAVAAEDAVPGEFLYPLKQVTERVRAFVDDDIAATHRVEEAERLVVRGAPIVEITRAVERAEAATSGLIEDRLLGPRLESIRERLRQQDEQESGASGAGGVTAIRSAGHIRFGLGQRGPERRSERRPAKDRQPLRCPRSAGPGEGDGKRLRTEGD